MGRQGLCTASQEGHTVRHQLTVHGIRTRSGGALTQANGIPESSPPGGRQKAMFRSCLQVTTVLEGDHVDRLGPAIHDGRDAPGLESIGFLVQDS
jgi:hypothetical protein